MNQDSIQWLDIDHAIQKAQQTDPWLMGNRHFQDSIESLSVAAGELPDPTISLGLANLPTNSLSFSQEAMTQAKIGISQMFPPGNSLNIKKRQLELQGSQFPFERADRRAKIAVTVGQLWLDAYKAQESIIIIEQNRSLFERLVDVAQSGYSTAMGKSRQQDIIRAQLELTRLDDRLTVLHQKQEISQQKLAEWLNGYFLSQYSYDPQENNQAPPPQYSLVHQIPDIKLINPHLYAPTAITTPEMLYERLSGHPMLKALDQKISANKAGIDLARQKYKPAWGVNAGYGHRSSDQLGNNRSDLFSVGVTFSVPLFTANRQDKEVQSAKSRTSAVKTEKWQLLRKLMAEFETAKAELLRLNERQKLYETQLLPQMNEQAEASLTAYTNDDGDFAEAVRARIAEMDTEVIALDINIERQKTILRLNYLFMTDTDEIIAGAQRSGDSK
ncbi:TolC family protein [Paremcibacter congregatus]|uniref:TolC family protein n=1 Tax=Paremcibacter congregatus TaxID=2043170 RepID=UPI0030EB817D